ncbi:flagellar protein FliT [Bordetella sp. 15P40C-2]|uniref:flagellar protein FliT n=1 Tax=Bordetella sp. 15P40C-2 TaxID=2572246 RepID=UPI001326EAD6|nr:flagellar protein FliT [Bordetella sp. 15P40C-2]MVW69949.1 flagellar protein FliT [Bordetella sp. 15P40C-2]
MPTTSASLSESSVIAIYQQIVTITGAMRIAAQDQDWDHLIELGQAYYNTVETLRGIPAAQLATLQNREDRAQLLRQILNNDAAVRDLAMPGLARLGQMLVQLNKQKCMLRAYGTPSGSMLQ